MTGKGSGKRGRPIGFRLSDESKTAISLSKIGQKHSKSTKDKISRSLILYFKRLNPLSDELYEYYKNYEDEVKWVRESADDIDLSEDILTIRDMRNRFKKEDNFGKDIESFGHTLTPELLLLFKEYCENNNIKIEDVL